MSCPLCYCRKSRPLCGEPLNSQQGGLCPDAAELPLGAPLGLRSCPYADTKGRDRPPWACCVLGHTNVLGDHSGDTDPIVRALAVGSWLGCTGGWVHPQDAAARESGANVGVLLYDSLREKSPRREHCCRWALRLFLGSDPPAPEQQELCGEHNWMAPKTAALSSRSMPPLSFLWPQHQCKSPVWGWFGVESCSCSPAVRG